jgi:hypothetical protein
VTYPLGATYQVRLAGTVVSHHVLQPGSSWEAHAQPQVGSLVRALSPGRYPQWTDRCPDRRSRGDRHRANQVFDLPPGHLTWVEGDEELVMLDWAGGAGFDVRAGESARVMATTFTRFEPPKTARCGTP